MTPERWKRISGLFADALSLPPAERVVFLDRACAGDTGLHREVDELLRLHQRSATPADGPTRPAAAEPAAPEPSLVGRRVGVYQVLAEIGRGGMGVVYLANDTRLGRPVALKTLPPAFAADPQRRQRLRLEAQAAAALSHPGIAAVYHLEDEGEFPYIVSEYVRGRSLRDALADGPLPRSQLIDVACAVGEALAAAHAQGVVHRDLKPDNVLLPDAGGVKLVDFGLARFLDGLGGDVETGRLTRTGALLGTPAYMAPEQLRGVPADARSDVFAFGVTVIEASTGVHPFLADTPTETLLRVAQQEVDFAPIASRGLGALVPILRRCTAKDAAARYASAREVSAAIETVRAVLISASSPELVPPPPPPALEWWRAHQVVVSVICTLMLWPLSAARSLTPLAAPMFFAALVPAIVIVALRLFFLYLSWLNERALIEQLARWRGLLLAADLAFAAVMAAAAAAVSGGSLRLAALFLTASLGLAISALIIEPATAREAFPRHGAPPAGNA